MARMSRARRSSERAGLIAGGAADAQRRVHRTAAPRRTPAAARARCRLSRCRCLRLRGLVDQQPRAVELGRDVGDDPVRRVARRCRECAVASFSERECAVERGAAETERDRREHELRRAASRRSRVAPRSPARPRLRPARRRARWRPAPQHRSPRASSSTVTTSDSGSLETMTAAAARASASGTAADRDRSRPPAARISVTANVRARVARGEQVGRELEGHDADSR